ncbi:rhomboid family intramembrane serine protease [Pontiella agarivorans]|uniref:Rhomboid family intramembrane serine protease n=1 Tax=Pontiella agarivorans TaxID=3038953 RepID=A0ABU5MSM5_9BACT|nr:rhomboid family intramembrane serine protease [Pontiella agarivorans]MDZ8117205.1 rhomboid family intramembrane serine protease [Pontiella agarivorans]
MYNRQAQNIGGIARITPSVKFLLIVNVVVYFIDSFTSSVPEYRFLTNTFALQASWWTTPFGFGELFTYMFIHASIGHLLMNMMGLYFLGPTLERGLGPYRFFILYYTSGILGGLGWSLLAGPGQICVGASGAVMGVLGAFAMLYPNTEVALIFLPNVPFKAWKFVLVLMLFEFFQTFVHPLIGGIANAAHLVGGLAGMGYAMTIRHPHIIERLKTKLPDLGKKKAKPRAKSSAQPTLSKAEVDAILDKIGKEGMGALTPREREMLKRATRG